MPEHLWHKVTGPSAGLVQQHYVNARLEALARRNIKLEHKLASLFRSHRAFAHLKLDGDKWLQPYRKITLALQDADLTINFKPESWFESENNFDSYTQMYERAGVGSDGKIRLKSTPGNPAATRAEADDKVTFDKWKAPHVPQHRGLGPGQQSKERIETQMAFGKRMERHTLFDRLMPDDDDDGGIRPKNAYFNPKTKQLFAALNYGRRPRGGCVYYGVGHLILHPRLKVNALYYGGDTFGIAALGAGAAVQVPFPALGSILAHAKTVGFSHLVDAIIQSCYHGSTLDDTGDAMLLLEGHIFGALPFKGNLSAVCLPMGYAHSEIAKNAKKFAVKYGAKLQFTM